MFVKKLPERDVIFSVITEKGKGRGRLLVLHTFTAGYHAAVLVLRVFTTRVV